ncbi:uncharacterized protein LOC117293354 [Asterias rubens]|uniref:uncharacterized protein LOC117293354 n=1 Tax=Asterias rubens TaxID=7604 RepID=UPI001455D500|nr:uncharacterized protein LOC117293354 [Asterias rubens]
MKFLMMLSLLVGVLCWQHVVGQTVVTNTSLGQIMGEKISSFGFPPLTRYSGIPYAEPPIGPLRFAKPVPKAAWDGILNATMFGPSCPQFFVTFSEALDQFLPNRDIDEDCLTLNMYIPDNDMDIMGPLPVMVYIHGGGFVNGQGSLYDGTILALQGKVIVVTINYRLGLFGFLSTGDDSAPGNYGLWDQRLAIQWVKNNIANLGGDPNKVTIFGESAGGWSVTYQMASPLNDRTLFQRVIAQSGAAFPGIITPTDVARYQAWNLGEVLGCNLPYGSTTRHLINCLREFDMQTLQNNSSFIIAGAVIDGDFLPNINYLTSLSQVGQYDLLMGVNSQDGSVISLHQRSLTTEELKAAILLITTYTCACSNPEDVTNALLTFYYGADKLDDPRQNVLKAIDVGGDLYFDIPSVNFLHRHVESAENTNTYFYYFTYDVGKEFLISAEFLDLISGAPHGLDIFYMFGYAQVLLTSSSEAMMLAQQSVQYWADFAHNGNPNGAGLPEWPKFNAENETYLILEPNITTGQHLKADKVAFWRDYVPTIAESIYSETCSTEVPVRGGNSKTTVDKTVVITSKDGDVLGSVIGAIRIADEAVGGEEVVEFLGIPYAKPPIGDLRYRAPQETGPWGDEPLGFPDKLPPACPQDIPLDPWMVRAGLTEVSEDCLTLNIYAPLVANNSSLPVVIFIHPGGGTVGASSVYDAVPLSSNIEAVVVVINHRLGALGFLSTEDEEAPGNYGLHDALASLKWVSKYIGSFGGDSHHITVIGHGSGSVIAHLLVMSEKVEGLFQQAVLMSASGLVRPLSNPVQPSPIEQARILARSVDCPIDSNEVMIKCLREKPALDVAGSSRYSPFEIPFRPIIDGNILTDDPRALLKSGTINNVDLIIGMTQDEVSAISFPLFFSNVSFCPTQEEAEGIIAVVSRASFNNPEKAAIAFSTEYLGWKGMEDECLTRGSVRQFMQDMLTVSPTLEAAELHAALGKEVFLYLFDHKPSSHYYSYLPPQAGPAFADDLQFLFGDPYSSHVDEYKLTYRLQDKQMSLEMMTLCKNFIHNGKPGVSRSGVEWPRFDRENLAFMSLTGCPEVQSGWDYDWPHLVQFWSNLLPSITMLSPSAKPTNYPDTTDPTEPCLVGKGIGLNLTQDEATFLIEVLVGALIGSLILSVLFLGGCVAYKTRSAQYEKQSKTVYQMDNYDNSDERRLF